MHVARTVRSLLLVLILAAPLMAPTVAHADPAPTIGTNFPMCGVAPDDDGRYCIQSMTRNGTPIVPPATGTYDAPFVDLIGAGHMRFGVTHNNVDTGAQDGDVSPTDVFELVVHSGAIRPVEVFGNARNVTFLPGGSAAAGWTWTLRLQAVPIAWKFFAMPRCQVNDCGDETTVADLRYDGFVTGFVTDLVGFGSLTAAEITQRVGVVHAYSAQDAIQPYYDEATRSFVVQIANPHFRSPGVVATGSYEAFLPNAMLVGAMHIPDPASLTGGSFIVSRASAGATTTSVPFTLTHTPRGVQIRITGITFSSPTIRIRARLSKPGAPILRSAARTSPTRATLRFLGPRANGGRAILRYVARCSAPMRPTVVAAGRRSPLLVTGLRPRVAYRCSVRAVNVIGIGRASAIRMVALAPITS